MGARSTALEATCAVGVDAIYVMGLATAIA